jgi:lipid-A-disaccharide synthase-like uncharacterized protein
VHFWYLSIVGSLMLLAYAIAVADPVIIVGQAFGSLVYTRNLALMRRERAARVKPAMEQRSGTSV